MEEKLKPKDDNNNSEGAGGSTTFQDAMEAYQVFAGSQGFGGNAMCIPPWESGNPLLTDPGAWDYFRQPEALGDLGGLDASLSGIVPEFTSGFDLQSGVEEGPIKMECPCDTLDCAFQQVVSEEDQLVAAFGDTGFLDFLLEHELLPSEYHAILSKEAVFVFQPWSPSPIVVCETPFESESFCSVMAPEIDNGPLLVLGGVRSGWLLDTIFAEIVDVPGDSASQMGQAIKFATDEEAIANRAVQFCVHPGKWNGEKCELPEDREEEPEVIILDQHDCEAGTIWDGFSCSPIIIIEPERR